MRPVQVHDVADAEGFVRDIIRRKLRKANISRQDMDDMVQSGLLVLLELAKRYDPAKDIKKPRPGHVCRGPRCCVPSFAGYASFLMPNKLLDAWHAQHPNHLLKTQEDGSRKYMYLREACSLDEGPGGHGGGYGSGNSMAGDSNQEGFSSVDSPTTRHVGDFIPVPETS